MYKKTAFQKCLIVHTGYVHTHHQSESVFFRYLRTMADYYRHFKGGKYKLLGIAKDSETLEKMVVYQALYGEGEMWVRPYDMFFGTVERDGKVMPRFTRITEEEALGNE